MNWFWQLEHDDQVTEIFPNHSITIGKRSDCTIKTGKRQTATSKNFVTLNLSSTKDYVHVTIIKGATLKCFVDGIKVTATKPQQLKPGKHLFIENDDFDACFKFEPHLIVQTAYEPEKKFWPKTFSFEVDENLDSVKVLLNESLQFENADKKWIKRMELAFDMTKEERDFQTQNQQQDNSFVKPKVPKKVNKRGKKDAENLDEDGELEIETISNKKLSSRGQEDYEMIQEHLRQKALLPENYETPAQKLLKTIEIVKVKQKDISGLKFKPTIRKSIFKQKNIVINRPKLFYE